MQIPAILLEGDEPGSVSPPTPTGLHSGPAAPAVPASATGPLPEAYGTQRLKLTARDPNWIHARWDFTRDQLRQVRARAAGGELVLRLFQQSTQGPLVSETRVHPESLRWLLHTPEPNVPCVAEIGFYDKRHRWSALAASSAVRTPPAGPSGDRGFELATLAPDGTIRRHGTIKDWSHPAAIDVVGTSWGDPNSSSAALAGVSSPTRAFGSPIGTLSSPGIHAWSSLDSSSSLSSPRGGVRPPAFRLAVDAELTIYGATHPAALLQVEDRTVPIEADGSFRLRLALPDGVQVVPIKAVSTETGEQRTVELRFSRHTEAAG